MHKNKKLLAQLKNKELLAINNRRQNGWLSIQREHSELAGPDSMVGGSVDVDATGVLPVGNCSFVPPKNAEEHHRAYVIRPQWSKSVRHQAR